MCGIAALVKEGGLDLPLGVAREMAEKAAHRGPDGAGFVGFPERGTTRDPGSSDWTVALAHRRLAILDLSPAAAQPMARGERYWLSYNGEVYNYLELRSELEALGHRFRTTSDTEVLLAAFSEWGERCFARFRGMWGLVFFDAERRELTLCRDRIGIKPLYVWRSGGLVAAVSEIKQLLAIPSFRARQDEETVAEYLRTGYEDQARTFFDGVTPVPPGTSLRLSADTLSLSEPASYWDPERVAVSITDGREAASLFAKKLGECVRFHLRSDVPVGCSLSGGLDSSAIAVLAADSRPPAAEALHSFTATFPGERFDEREWADTVSTQIGSTPHYVTPSAEGFLDDLRDFTWHQDEPVGGMPIYAGYCVARITRNANVPVCLSGQGSDEILSGYWQSYFLHLRELALGGRLLTLAGHFLGSLTSEGNPSLLGQVPVMLRRLRARRKGGSLVGTNGNKARPSPILGKMLALAGPERRVEEVRSMFLPRLLKWDDRNSMAFGIEGRYPFLDHELIELCLSFSPELLYHRGFTKWPLRRGLSGLLPERIARRRSKSAFLVPQDRWLCGTLRPVLERWLTASRPLFDLVERPAVTRLAEETWGADGRSAEPGQALFRCFALDAWMEAFDVR